MSSALEFVMSANSLRRQLTDDQKAMIAVDYEKLFAIEAAKRQKAGKATSTKISHAESRSDARAAKAAGVTRSKVVTAKKISKTATPKDIDDVRKGKKTLKQIAPKTPKARAPHCVAVRDLRNTTTALTRALKEALGSSDLEYTTPKEVTAILDSFERVRDGMDAFTKALKDAKRLNSKLIKKDDKAALISKAFSTELGR